MLHDIFRRLFRYCIKTHDYRGKQDFGGFFLDDNMFIMEMIFENLNAMKAFGSYKHTVN